jgi:hypothetical protein
LCPGCDDIRIEDRHVSYRDAAGQRAAVPARGVFIAKGAEPGRRFAQALRQAGLAVSEVGDGAAIGFIEGAMASAAALCRTLVVAPGSELHQEQALSKQTMPTGGG